MLIVRRRLVELIPQRAHAVDTMDKLQVATALIVHAGIIDDGVAHGFVDPPGDVKRHPRVVEPLGPRILVHHHTPDAAR